MKSFLKEIRSKIINQLIKDFYLEFGSDFKLKSSIRKLTFVVSLTTKCNFRCPHCLRNEIDNDKTLVKDLPVSIFEKVLKEARKMNFRTVSLTGGEPIFHNKFEDIIYLINKYDYSYNFVTNGSFYEEYWQIIKKNVQRLDCIFLSLDGTTPEIHDSIRNKIGSFEQVMKAIEFYKKKGVKIIINFCVNKKNYHQIDDLPNFCIKKGLSCIKWLTVIPFKEKTDFYLSDFILSNYEKLEALRKILKLQEENKDKFFFIITSSFFSVSLKRSKKEIIVIPNFCPVLNNNTFYIDHDGGMLICCDISRSCIDKPLVDKLGFAKSFEITIYSAAEIKKQLLSYLLNKNKKLINLCDFCNNNIDFSLKSAKEKVFKEINN